MISKIKKIDFKEVSIFVEDRPLMIKIIKLIVTKSKKLGEGKENFFKEISK